MRFSFVLLVFLLVLALTSEATEAKSPCNYRQDVGDCLAKDEGWNQVARQQYDKDSDIVTILEKQSSYIICMEKPDHSAKKCAPYSGNVEAFRTDAERETAARAVRAKEEKARQNALEAEKREKTKDLGIGLKENGWKEIASCKDGHQWSYVLEKDGNRKFCSGINARGGPTESPCTPFIGDLEKFKVVASKAEQQTVAYNIAKALNRLDEFLKERIKQRTPLVDCWNGFGQADP